MGVENEGISSKMAGGDRRRAYRQIALPYQIEKPVRGKEAVVRLAARRDHATPNIAAPKPWLEAQISRMPRDDPNSPRTSAARWRDFPGLIRFLEDGRLERDTDPVGNRIRPIA